MVELDRPQKTVHTLQAHWVLDEYGCKDTLRICNTYCFSMAKTVTCKCLSVTLYKQCLSFSSVFPGKCQEDTLVPVLNEVSFHKDIWENRGTAACFLNFGTRLKQVVSFQYQPLYHQENTEYEAGLDGLGEKQCCS